MACLDRRSYLRGRRARPARPQRPPAGADRRKPAPHQGPTGRTQGLSEDAVDMTLRLDNACGVDHMPTAATADENPIIGFWFGIDRAPQMMPGKVRQNASLPRARSTRNGGRDQIGILGDLKSECLGEIIGIRIVSNQAENSTYRRLIVELAATSGLPTIYPYREQVEAGGLMAY